jgi:cellulose synthase (UDP-forming)
MNKRLLIDAFVLLALIAIIVYVVTRSVLLGFADYEGFDKVTAFLLLFGEFFVILHGVGYTLNIFRAYRYQKAQNALQNLAHIGTENEPAVAILVAARHEPKVILEETFISLKNIKYKNKEIFFLDDSSDKKYLREAEEISKELGIHLFRRKIRHGAKAGIVNDCLKTLSHKYVAIFDADQNPMPEFLNKLVPIMENDDKLSFVQTPQFYTNIEESRVARAAAFQQAVFYEYICEGKSSQDAMFCCGTNIVFRRQALKEVGGLDESTVTEDFATSIKLHQKKWKSLYYNHVNAFGMAPQNLSSYFKQQYRWANGTISVLKRILWNFLIRPFSLKPKQWWEYFLSGSYYIVGLAFFILMMFPILFLLLNIPSFFARPEVYFLTFLPYIMLSIGVFYFVLKGRNYTIKDLFLGQLLGSVTFSIYLRAAFFSLIGQRTTFGITEKSKGAAIPYITMWPQLLLLLLNYIAIIWGINRFLYEREPAIIINSFWAFYHCMVLSSVFYFNQADGPSSSCKSLKKDVLFEYKIIKSSYALKGLTQQAWQTCLSVFLPEKLAPYNVIMCKIKGKGDETIVFDAHVMYVRDKSKKGYKTAIGVVTIANSDKDKLEKEFLV